MKYDSRRASIRLYLHPLAWVFHPNYMRCLHMYGFQLDTSRGEWTRTWNVFIENDCLEETCKRTARTFEADYAELAEDSPMCIDHPPPAPPFRTRRTVGTSLKGQTRALGIFRWSTSDPISGMATRLCAATAAHPTLPPTSRPRRVGDKRGR